MESVIDYFNRTYGPERKEPFTLLEMLSFAEKYANDYTSMPLLTAIASEFEINEALIFAKSRKQEIVEARQMYSLILTEQLRLKPQIIAEHLGQDRVTTRHGIIKMSDHITTEPQMRAIYVRLRDQILSGKVTLPERLIKNASSTDGQEND